MTSFRRVAPLAVGATLVAILLSSTFQISHSQSSHPGVKVTCADFRTAATVDVYAERVTASGEVHAGWVPDSNRLCLGTGQQYSFSIASDGGGGSTRDRSGTGGRDDVGRRSGDGPEVGGAEHTKDKRPSTKERHEKGQGRKGRDKRGGEKGDARRPY